MGNKSIPVCSKKLSFMTVEIKPSAEYSGDAHNPSGFIGAPR
jgi:hypothetical protein